MNTMNFDTVRLEKVKFGIVTRLSQDFAIPSNVDWSAESDFLTDDICLRVRQCILAQKLETVKAEWPADWWEALKARFAPAWFLRRWPVRYERRVLEAQALYPKIALPQNEHYMQLSIRHAYEHE